MTFSKTPVYQHIGLRYGRLQRVERQWDGVDEDDHPLSDSELEAVLQVALKKRGRPAGSGTKEQVAIRFDREVLAAFRAGGAGWQTRMNDALKDWLRTHSAA